MSNAIILAIPPGYADEKRRFPRVVVRWDVREKGYQYLGPDPWAFTVAGVEHAIPPGYLFDGASVFSVTGLAWAIASTPGDPGVLWASMEHDWLCDTRPSTTTSRQAAERFRDVLQWCKLPAWKIAIMYRAVVLFGPRWG